jgi:Ca2+:H+ antiporter
MRFKLTLPVWTIAAPVIAWLLYLFKPAELGNLSASLIGISVMGAVMASVHHAEVIAHKVGEPYGTLVLAVAVTVIEVSLIVSLMLEGGEDTAALARDTVFAAVMIILTGIIGICLLVGGLKFHEQVFGKHGVSAALTTLTAITVLTLVLPNFTTSIPGPVYTKGQLIFVALVSLILYAAFVLAQTVRHRDYFLPEHAVDHQDVHAAPPSGATAITSTALLLLCLGAVVLLAKTLSPIIENVVDNLGAPKALVGIIVAAVILLPEGMAAVRAARNNRLQNSLNLALGSALASIGLTIPAVAVVSVIGDFPVTLGIDTKSMVLLFLSMFTIMLSFGTGRTNFLQGVVLLLIFAVYLFTTVVP